MSGEIEASQLFYFLYDMEVGLGEDTCVHVIYYRACGGNPRNAV
jgi:hypothetical protein